jgi:hypothetical protein
MLTACSMLLIKDWGEVQRGVSRMYSTTVGKLLANSSGVRQQHGTAEQSTAQQSTPQQSTPHCSAVSAAQQAHQHAAMKDIT